MSIAGTVFQSLGDTVLAYSINIGDIGTLLGALVALAGLLGGAVYKVIPWIKLKRHHKKLRLANEQAIHDVIIGRPGGPANIITGEPGTPPLPSITERMNEFAELIREVNSKTDGQNAEIAEMKRLIKNSTETRISKLEEETTEMSGQIRRILILLRENRDENNS